MADKRKDAGLEAGAEERAGIPWIRRRFRRCRRLTAKCCFWMDALAQTMRDVRAAESLQEEEEEEEEERVSLEE